jgi:hypothetical protein
MTLNEALKASETYRSSVNGGMVDVLADGVRRLHEALALIAAGTVCPDLFPNETNEDALAAKTAMTIAMAALEVSSQSQNDAQSPSKTGAEHERTPRF